MRPTGRRLTDSLHLFTLCGFAVAQPLYDLLARHAAFFAAQGSRPADVLSLVILLSLLLPAALVLLTTVFVGRPARPWAHAAAVAGLVALIALPALKKIGHAPGGVLVA